MKTKFHKNVYRLGWVSFFTDLSSQMIYPILPGYLTSLGASAAVIGFIEGIGDSVAALLKGISGRMADKRQNRKGFVSFGYGFSAMARLLLLLQASWLMVLSFKLVDRTGKAFRGPARDAIIANSVPATERGAAFGFQRSFDKVGSLLGPLIAVAVMYYWPQNYKLLFWIAFFPALVALYFIAKVQDFKIIKGAQEELSKAMHFSKPLVWFMVANAVFTLGNFSNAFLILKATQVGTTQYLIPFLWAFYNFVCAFAAPMLGQLSDRLKKQNMILFSMVFYAILYYLFATCTDPVLIWMLFALYGIYYGLTEGVTKAYLAQLIPAHKRATGFGIFETISGILLFPASLIAGFLWNQVGSVYTFYFASLCALLAFAIFFMGNILSKAHG